MVHSCNGILFGHEHKHIIAPHNSMVEYGGNNCKTRRQSQRLWIVSFSFIKSEQRQNNEGY